MTAEACPVCDGEPRVLVAMRHPAMLQFTRELLEREFGCWVTTDPRVGEPLAGTIRRVEPDLLVVDASDYPGCCPTALAHMPPSRVIVVGPEPDPAYRAAALANGAAAWLPREAVGEELGREMRRVLGCVHDPCPPGNPRRPRRTAVRGARRYDPDATPLDATHAGGAGP